MTTWTGAGHTPAFTLSDDEVLALVRNIVIESTPASSFPAAHLAYRHLQARAEQIINEQRAERHGG